MVTNSIKIIIINVTSKIDRCRYKYTHIKMFIYSYKLKYSLYNQAT